MLYYKVGILCFSYFAVWYFLCQIGSVIKAWDLAVATMKRGELCVIQCKAEYGYGKKGSKPKIPPNSTLIFEIELFDWKGLLHLVLVY